MGIGRQVERNDSWRDVHYQIHYIRAKLLSKSDCRIMPETMKDRDLLLKNLVEKKQL